MSCPPHLDRDQVSNLSDEHNPKLHFRGTRPEGRFNENLVRYILIIGSKLDIMKKSLTTPESIHIELIFRKKIVSQAEGLCQNKQLENAPNRQKTAKIGTLSLISRLTGAPIVKILMFVTTTSYQKRFHKEISKLAQIFSKNLEIHGLCTIRSIMVR